MTILVSQKPKGQFYLIYLYSQRQKSIKLFHFDIKINSIIINFTLEWECEKLIILIKFEIEAFLH